MNKLLILLFSFSLMGCRYLKPHSSGPSEEHIFKDQGIIEGVAQTDYDQIYNASFDGNLTLTIQSGGRTLNMYEYELLNKTLYFKKQVNYVPGGQISFIVPRIPAVPKGAAYLIEWSHS